MKCNVGVREGGPRVHEALENEIDGDEFSRVKR